MVPLSTNMQCGMTYLQILYITYRTHIFFILWLALLYVTLQLKTKFKTVVTACLTLRLQTSVINKGNKPEETEMKERVRKESC